MGQKKKIKTEHSGAKNGGGHFGKREEAKQISKKLRRENEKHEIKSSLNDTEYDSEHPQNEIIAFRCYVVINSLMHELDTVRNLYLDSESYPKKCPRTGRDRQFYLKAICWDIIASITYRYIELYDKALGLIGIAQKVKASKKWKKKLEQARKYRHSSQHVFDSSTKEIISAEQVHNDFFEMQNSLPYILSEDSVEFMSTLGEIKSQLEITYPNLDKKFSDYFKNEINIPIP